MWQDGRFDQVPLLQEMELFPWSWALSLHVTFIVLLLAKLVEFIVKLLLDMFGNLHLWRHWGEVVQVPSCRHNIVSFPYISLPFWQLKKTKILQFVGRRHQFNLSTIKCLWRILDYWQLKQFLSRPTCMWMYHSNCSLLNYCKHLSSLKSL